MMTNMSTAVFYRHLIFNPTEALNLKETSKFLVKLQKTAKSASNKKNIMMRNILTAVFLSAITSFLLRKLQTQRKKRQNSSLNFKKQPKVHP